VRQGRLPIKSFAGMEMNKFALVIFVRPFKKKREAVRLLSPENLAVPNAMLCCAAGGCAVDC